MLQGKRAEIAVLVSFLDEGTVRGRVSSCAAETESGNSFTFTNCDPAA